MFCLIRLLSAGVFLMKNYSSTSFYHNFFRRNAYLYCCGMSLLSLVIVVGGISSFSEHKF